MNNIYTYGDYVIRKGTFIIVNYTIKIFLLRKVGGGTNGGVGIENLMLKNLLTGMKDTKKGQRYLREGINLEVKQ